MFDIHFILLKTPLKAGSVEMERCSPEVPMDVAHPLPTETSPWQPRPRAVPAMDVSSPCLLAWHAEGVYQAKF